MQNLILLALVCLCVLLLREIKILLLSIIQILKQLQAQESSAPASVHFTIDGKKMESPMQLKDSEKVTLALEFDDAKGFPVNPALDAAPAWGLDDASMGQLNVSDDGLSAEFVPAKPGLAHVQFSCSIGGQAFAASSEDLVVVSGDAVSVQLKVSAPVAQ